MQTKIKEGQIWRNKEKGYPITVLTKLKNNIWKVSAHGKGRTTHKMTENSFHFYDLISEDNLEPITKEEKMNLNNKIRIVFNTEFEKNDIFSVDDVINFLIQIDVLENFKKEKLKSSTSAFISTCLKTKTIKKLSDKRKVSSSKKVYQKLDDNHILQKKKYLSSNANINTGLFKKIFNEQIEVNQKFTISEFMQKIITTVNCDELNKEETNIIKSRINSFISIYIKKDCIKKISETSELIKLKYIDDSRVIPSEDVQETKSKIEIDIEDKSEIDQPDYVEENGLNTLLKKFKNSPLSELVESFVLYFNILQEKEKSYRAIIDKFKVENMCVQKDKENIDGLKEKLKIRETKIISLNKEIGSLKDKVKQLDNDVNHQLDENERLITINADLNSKVVKTEPTDAWKKLNIGDVLSV
jgi:hypothetical protein